MEFVEIFLGFFIIHAFLALVMSDPAAMSYNMVEKLLFRYLVPFPLESGLIETERHVGERSRACADPTLSTKTDNCAA